MGPIWLSDSDASLHQDAVHLVLGLAAPLLMSLPVLFLAAPRTIRGNLAFRTVQMSNPHLVAIITATSTVLRRPLYVIEVLVFRSVFNLLLRQERDIQYGFLILGSCRSQKVAYPSLLFSNGKSSIIVEKVFVAYRLTTFAFNLGIDETRRLDHDLTRRDLAVHAFQRTLFFDKASNPVPQDGQ